MIGAEKQGRVSSTVYTGMHMATHGTQVCTWLPMVRRYAHGYPWYTGIHMATHGTQVCTWLPTVHRYAHGYPQYTGMSTWLPTVHRYAHVYPWYTGMHMATHCKQVCTWLPTVHRYAHGYPWYTGMHMATHSTQVCTWLPTIHRLAEWAAKVMTTAQDGVSLTYSLHSRKPSTPPNNMLEPYHMKPTGSLSEHVWQTIDCLATPEAL